MVMNRVFLTAFAAVVALAAEPAMGADMGAPAYKAPSPPPMPVYSWTGFYLNLGGGYGLWDANVATTNLDGSCTVVTAACATQTLGGRGYFGTGGGGYDYQFNDRIVIGVQADYDFMHLKGTIEDNSAPAVVGPLNETSAWAAGVRAGWLMAPQFLTYFNGGVTGTRFGGTTLNLNTGGGPLGATQAFTQTGWFIGGGTETTLTPFLPAGWFLRSEYRYSSFGNEAITQTISGAPINIINFKPYVQTLSTSILYKFNWFDH